jgi:hypothetical protein
MSLRLIRSIRFQFKAVKLLSGDGDHRPYQGSSVNIQLPLLPAISHQPPPSDRRGATPAGEQDSVGSIVTAPPILTFIIKALEIWNEGRQGINECAWF